MTTAARTRLSASLRNASDASRWQRLLASGLAALIFALGLLTASADAHGELHEDADHPEHVCAITLAADGFCDTTAEPPTIVLGSAEPAPLNTAPAETHWCAPEYWHLPAQAPPHLSHA